MAKLNPVKSLLKTIMNLILGNISFPGKYKGKTVVMSTGEKYKIFRHIKIKSSKELNPDRSVFIVQFKLKNMSTSKNRLFSLLPIAMFVGLPGFKEKFWMCNNDTGINQGIYQWESYNAAKDYSNSFAVKFMTKRSVPGSVKYNIIPNSDILDNSFLDLLI